MGQKTTVQRRARHEAIATSRASYTALVQAPKVLGGQTYRQRNDEMQKKELQRRMSKEPTGFAREQTDGERKRWRFEKKESMARDEVGGKSDEVWDGGRKEAGGQADGGTKNLGEVPLYLGDRGATRAGLCGWVLGVEGLWFTVAGRAVLRTTGTICSARATG